MKSKKGKHFTFEDRNKIEKYIHNGNTVSYMAKKLHKSVAAVKYEIARHLQKAPAPTIMGQHVLTLNFVNIENVQTAEMFVHLMLNLNAQEGINHQVLVMDVKSGNLVTMIDLNMTQKMLREHIRKLFLLQEKELT